MAGFDKLISKFLIFLVLLICQLTLIEAVSVEPMCSKFSYDEQLLEKMVRMEFYMENVQKDSEKSVSNVMDMIHDIQGNNSELSNRLSEQQEKVDSLERQTDILNETMANKSVVSENTESIRSIAEDVRNIRNDLENNTSGLDNLMVITDAINKKCKDGLSDLSKDLERQTNVLSDTMANKSIVSENTESIRSIAADVRNIKNDLENNTSGLDNLMVITDEINKKCEDGLLDLSKNLERQTNVLSDTMANKSIVSENTESIKSFEVIVENIKKDLEKSTSGLDDIKTVTDEVKATCKDGLIDLSKKLAALEMQIKELIQATEKKTETVAFNALRAESYTGDEAIKFSYILLNEGKAFNKYTGMFTAPIDGIYQFNAHICGRRYVAEIEYYIKVGSNRIVTGEFTLPNKATDPKCTSFSAVAFVRKGEHVRVGGMKFSDLDGYADDDLSSFSGVLIRTV